MSNAARKARKRAGETFTKPQKKPTRPYLVRNRGFGLVRMAEILAGIVVRGRS